MGFLPHEVGTLDIVGGPSFNALIGSLGKLGKKPLELTMKVFVPEAKRRLLVNSHRGFPEGFGPIHTRVKFFVTALKQLDSRGYVKIQGCMCHESVNDARIIDTVMEYFEADLQTDQRHGKRGTLRMSMYLGHG